MNRGNYRHGMWGTRTWNAWSQMKKRVLNPKDISYPRYGGRGISIDVRWMDFPTFLADMGECPAGLSLERLDNSKGYIPGNCCWATPTEQANNRRSTKLLTISGRTQTQARWAREIGCDVNTLKGRIAAGWSDAKILTPPLPRWTRERNSDGTH